MKHSFLSLGVIFICLTMASCTERQKVKTMMMDFMKTEIMIPDDLEWLEKADKAFGNVITASPTTADAYIFRARTNKLLEKDELMAQYYEDFLRVVKEKGPEEMEANKVKVVEAYNNIGAHYANSDKVKAIEYFNKVLSLDPANNYATQSIQSLK